MPRITFIQADGREEEFDAPEGMSVLEIARECQLPIPGICEGSMRCSTCHVIVDEASFNKLEPAGEDEEAILDQAFHLTGTSRLGCQIVLCAELDGIRVTLPASTNNQLK